MANEKRSGGINQTGLNAGPYIGRVISHLDKNYMGTLEVEILKATGSNNDTRADGQTFQVKYASPFYGQTPYSGVTNNVEFKYGQQAYGMWFIPPDVGTRVLVTFVEGQPNSGYWFACLPDNYTNFAVPDKAATSYVTKEKISQIDTSLFATATLQLAGKLPAGEINKKLASNQGVDPTKFPKPFDVDHFNVLVKSGLSADSTRGLTTSSARRELPSMVFGINTPGPYDKRPGSPTVSYGTKDASAKVPFSRLSGHHFVMDDGDDKLLRKGPAATTPKEYVNVEAGEKGGDVTLPHNELLRLRTRTGHQILMHNTEDLIYINHGSGNAWIELSANGKIDIFAQDSISMHTAVDLNITADRDINLHAGRNTNILSESDIQIETPANFQQFVKGNSKWTTLKDHETFAGGHIWETSIGTNETKANGNIIETAPNIHMNGPEASSVLPLTPLAKHVVPGPSQTSVPGATATDEASLHKRLPQAEPWHNHENVDPMIYTAIQTDRTNTDDLVGSVSSTGEGPAKPDVGLDRVDTFKKSGT